MLKGLVALALDSGPCALLFRHSLHQSPGPPPHRNDVTDLFGVIDQSVLAFQLHIQRVELVVGEGDRHVISLEQTAALRAALVRQWLLRLLRDCWRGLQATG